MSRTSSALLGRCAFVRVTLVVTRATRAGREAPRAVVNVPRAGSLFSAVRVGLFTLLHYECASASIPNSQGSRRPLLASQPCMHACVPCNLCWNRAQRVTLLALRLAAGQHARMAAVPRPGARWLGQRHPVAAVAAGRSGCRSHGAHACIGSSQCRTCRRRCLRQVTPLQTCASLWVSAVTDRSVSSCPVCSHLVPNVQHAPKYSGALAVWHTSATGWHVCLGRHCSMQHAPAALVMGAACVSPAGGGP